MINLVDEAGALSTEEFHELKNFVVDECLCTQVETPWLEYVKIRADGDTGYKGYWTAQWDEVGLDKRNVKAVIILNATYLKTLEDMKKTLAHEFGHHWTLGYMIENFEQDIWKERMPLDYYRMRGLDLDNFAPDYSKDWYHCDKEVLAEDYKYFYSPFDGEHRMKNLVGNPSEEIKAKIVDLGLGARRSWEELVRCRFSKSK